MGLRDRARALFGRQRQEEATATDAQMADGSIIPGRPSIVVARGGLSEYEGNLLSLVSRGAARQATAMETLRTIRDYNPDAALAIWNFLRLVNPGSTFQVFNISDKTIDEEGQEMLDFRCSNLAGVYGRDYGGGTSVLINVLTLTAVTQGAVAGELEMSENLDDVLDWCPINPNDVRFVRDADTGHFLPVASYHGTSYLLPQEQFRYIPVDPAVNDPYGRSPLWPELETAFFQVEVLRDLKKVAHFAGHPRLSMKVVRALYERWIPAHLKDAGREEEAMAWMNNILTEISSQYRTLQPDDALVFYDDVDPAPLDAGRPSYNIDALIEVVEAQVFSSLKQLPVLMGRHKGQGLAHGDIAWQIYAEGIKSLRQIVSTMMSWFGTQTLRIWGRQSICEFSFPALRSQDRLKEAQAERLEFDVALKKYVMGLITHEELGNQFTGHTPVAKPDIFAALGKPELGSGGPRPFEEQGALSEESAMRAFMEKLDRYVSAPNHATIGGNGHGQGCPSCDGERQEAEFFKVLPSWMRTRIGAVERSLEAYSTVRRDRVGDEVEGDEE